MKASPTTKKSTAPVRPSAPPPGLSRTPDADAAAITPLLVDAKTLASRYGISEKSIRKFGASGTLPFVKISRRCVRYPVADCDRILAARRVHAVSEI
jgi:hypothetical protein